MNNVLQEALNELMLAEAKVEAVLQSEFPAGTAIVFELRKKGHQRSVGIVDDIFDRTALLIRNPQSGYHRIVKARQIQGRLVGNA